MNKHRNFQPFLAAVMLLFAMFPFTAHAGLLSDVAALLSGNISPQDESVGMLKNVFGDFVMDPFNNSGAGSTAGNVIGAMFLQYNMFIFTVAMLWFAYTAFASLAQTMHEGVVFGQRMSTVWMPIRIAFGSVSLMPIFGGWAFCQALMMIAALLGIAGANSISKAAISSSAAFQTVVNPMGGVKQAATLYNVEANMLKMVACQRAAEQMAQQSSANGVQMSGNNASSYSATIRSENNNTIIMDFPSKNGTSACGTIKMTFSPRGNNSLSNPLAGTFGFRVNGINYEGIRQQSMIAHANALRSLYAEARVIVANLQNLPGAQTALAWAAINKGYFNHYSTTFQAQLNALNTSTNASSGVSAIDAQLRLRMEEGGWATLGSWYGIFAEVNEAMNEMLDPVVSFANLAPASSEEEMLLSRIESGIRTAKEVAEPPGFMRSATNDLSLGQWLMGGAMNALVASSGTGAGNTINPIIAMKNIGDNALVLAQTVYVAAKFVGTGDTKKNAVVEGLQSAAETAANLTGFGRILTTIKNIFSDMAALAFPLSLGLFAVGATMAFYLPMLPFIQWFASLVHWFITIVESFLGASLWALAHFDSDGEGMGQRASYGYQYMLSNFARPIINTFAFFIASAAITVLGTFLFKNFGNAVASAQGNTLTGLISILAYLIIMGVMGIALVNNAFGIMLKLADTIIGFVGSSAASAFQNDTENRINVMFASALRGGSQALSSRGPGRNGAVGRAPLGTAPGVPPAPHSPR